MADDGLSNIKVKLVIDDSQIGGVSAGGAGKGGQSEVLTELKKGRKETEKAGILGARGILGLKSAIIGAITASGALYLPFIAIETKKAVEQVLDDAGLLDLAADTKGLFEQLFPHLFPGGKPPEPTKGNIPDTLRALGGDQPLQTAKEGIEENIRAMEGYGDALDETSEKVVLLAIQEEISQTKDEQRRVLLEGNTFMYDILAGKLKELKSLEQIYAAGVAKSKDTIEQDTIVRGKNAQVIERQAAALERMARVRGREFNRDRAPFTASNAQQFVQENVGSAFFDRHGGIVMAYLDPLLDED